MKPIFCRLCADFETCKLEKRTKDLVFRSCRMYDQAETPIPVEDVNRFLLQVQAKASEEAEEITSKASPKIPFEISEDSLATGLIKRSLYLDFLEVNFQFDRPESHQEMKTIIEKKPNEKAELPNYIARVETYSKKMQDQMREDMNRMLEFLQNSNAPEIFLGNLLFETGGIVHRPNANFYRDMMAIQEDLGEMVQRWKEFPESFGQNFFPLDLEGRTDIVAQVYQHALQKRKQLQEDDFKLFGEDVLDEIQEGNTGNNVTDFFRLEAWINPILVHSLVPMEQGYVRIHTALAPPYEGVLYFLFALDVIDKQEFRRCPVCGTFFRLKNKRGPKSPTCGKTCREKLSRNKERYLNMQ